MAPRFANFRASSSVSWRDCFYRNVFATICSRMHAVVAGFPLISSWSRPSFGYVAVIPESYSPYRQIARIFHPALRRLGVRGVVPDRVLRNGARGVSVPARRLAVVHWRRVRGERING